jgi:HSP20 family protein
MSSITRWDPFREMISLRDVMDRLVDDAFVRGMPSGGLAGLAIDMYQTDDDVIVKAAIPGMKADDIQISVTGDVLTLSGEYKQSRDEEKANYLLREQRYGSFSRNLQLPTSVVADKAKAEFENGILTLTLPKAEAAKPKSITVKAK